ncbi:MAG: putative DNA binding domain-containing protein, partial [Lactococcus lactis]|nr:putative DNA binding domain-containing protein [Lactococcus lactis]
MITIGFIDLKKEKRGNMENKIDAEALLYLISQEESEIIEYKKDNTDPEQIGKYVSALANSAALLGREEAYMIWGIEDNTKNIIGTTFKPKQQKKGGEPFISWLERLLDPRLVIVFEEIHIEDKWVVVMILRMTVGRPISFKTQKYIRSGSSLKNLNDFPEKERELWRSFDARSFEREFAKTNCTEEEIFDLL